VCAHCLVSPSIEQSIGDWRIGVDSAVAEKRPVAADIFESFQVHVADEDFFAVVRGFRDDATPAMPAKWRRVDSEGMR
jgi:hypothetical protein